MALRASGSGSDRSCSPAETLDSTQHITPQQHDNLLPRLSGGSGRSGSGGKVTLRDQGDLHDGGQPQASRWTRRTCKFSYFAMMGNRSLIRNRVGFYDFGLYWFASICDIPSSGSSKALCKNSHSLCKLILVVSPDPAKASSSVFSAHLIEG